MDRRIDERFRKPRRTKGTPFYVQRNYWAAGVIVLGGFSWFLLELTPGFKALKKYQKEVLNKDSPEILMKQKHMELGLKNPNLDRLINRARERIAYKDEPEPQSWIAKMFASSGPDL